MTGFLVRRRLVGMPTLLVIVTVAFFMMRVAPDGPFDQERALPPDVEKDLQVAYDLDER